MTPSAQVSREAVLRVDAEAFGDRASPARESRDGVIVTGIEAAQVLPAVDDVILRPLAVTFTHHHRSFVRPRLQAHRHERELDAHQVHERALLAHAGALAATHLEAE